MCNKSECTNWLSSSVVAFMASISRGLRFLPILWSLLLVATVIMSRLVANSVNTEDTVRTKAFQFAQSIFGQVLDLLSLVGLLSIIVRYLHLEMLNGSHNEQISPCVGRLRKASLAFGTGSMLGITVISNFRQIDELEYKSLGTVHHIGRMLVGLCGIIYCYLQTIITYQLSKLEISTVKLFVVRVVVSSLLCTSGFVHVTTEVWLATRLLKENPQLSYKPWYSHAIDSEAFVPHIISDISEWVTFLLFGIFSLTYFPEFRDLGVEMNCSSKDYENKRTSATDSWPMLKRQGNSWDEY